MKYFALVFGIFFYTNFLFATEITAEENALRKFVEHSLQIQTEPIRRVLTSQNGRIKPLDTLSRETVLMLTGKYNKFGMDPVQFLLALSSIPESDILQIIEIRDPELRLKLGFPKQKRFFSLAELESSNLAKLARGAFKKQEEGDKLNESEKKITETYGQMVTAQQIILGDFLVRAIDLSWLTNLETNSPNETIGAKIQEYIALLKSNKYQDAQNISGNLVAISRSQPVPELFTHYLNTLDLEILYNDLRLFLWTSILCVLISLIFLIDFLRLKFSFSKGLALQLFPLLPLIIGLTIRVYITKFAPVTNMYGTMLWVALGVLCFSSLLFCLYKNWQVSGFMLLTSGLILLLTEQIPLVLSPDLDPIVAVLRSNFWLSTHVTTITISYAAFSIAMVLGNIALIRLWTHKDNAKFFKDYAHYTYRMIQLGCFLLTLGIILGGVWADYSWGRFWGWDPKETWALIADMGFLVLLHGRHVGWINDFKLLAFAPVAYLLVIMAWYGVNFILAAGLHSYGFSSGGAMAVSIFIGLQALLLLAGAIRYQLKSA